jgi:hypothetical protein
MAGWRRIAETTPGPEHPNPINPPGCRRLSGAIHHFRQEGDPRNSEYILRFRPCAFGPRQSSPGVRASMSAFRTTKCCDTTSAARAETSPAADMASDSSPEQPGRAGASNGLPPDRFATASDLDGRSSRSFQKTAGAKMRFDMAAGVNDQPAVRCCSPLHFLIPRVDQSIRQRRRRSNQCVQVRLRLGIEWVPEIAAIIELPCTATGLSSSWSWTARPARSSVAGDADRQRIPSSS